MDFLKKYFDKTIQRSVIVILSQILQSTNLQYIFNLFLFSIVFRVCDISDSHAGFRDLHSQFHIFQKNIEYVLI